MLAPGRVLGRVGWIGTLIGKDIHCRAATGLMLLHGGHIWERRRCPVSSASTGDGRKGGIHLLWTPSRAPSRGDCNCIAAGNPCLGLRRAGDIVAGPSSHTGSSRLYRRNTSTPSRAAQGRSTSGGGRGTNAVKYRFDLRRNGGSMHNIDGKPIRRANIFVLSRSWLAAAPWPTRILVAVRRRIGLRPLHMKHFEFQIRSTMEGAPTNTLQNPQPWKVCTVCRSEVRARR